jgi:hypothetical protein
MSETGWSLVQVLTDAGGLPEDEQATEAENETQSAATEATQA